MTDSSVPPRLRSPIRWTSSSITSLMLESSTSPSISDFCPQINGGDPNSSSDCIGLGLAARHFVGLIIIFRQRQANNININLPSRNNHLTPKIKQRTSCVEVQGRTTRTRTPGTGPGRIWWGTSTPASPSAWATSYGWLTRWYRGGGRPCPRWGMRRTDRGRRAKAFFKKMITTPPSLPPRAAATVTAGEV